MKKQRILKGLFIAICLVMIAFVGVLVACGNGNDNGGGGNVAVTSVTIQGGDRSLGINETEGLQLEVEVGPENATNPAVNWTSSNPAVATATGGLLELLTVGYTDITATSVSTPAISDTVRITVTGENGDVAVASVVIVGADRSLYLNATEGLQLTAEVDPDNATNPAVNWTSSNQAVATINATTGLLELLTVGFTDITATSVSTPTVYDTIRVTVAEENIPIQSITITPATTVLTEIGEELQLEVQLYPANATGSVQFISSNLNVATVSEAGIVTAVANGTANIRVQCATTSSIFNTAFITVREVGLSLNLQEVNLIRGGDPVTVSATVTNTVPVNTAVTWEIEDESVATVVNGVVTAVEIGETTLTVTSVADPRRSVTIPVTVVRANITLNYNEVNLTLGGATVTLTATVPEVSDQSVTWVSDNTSIVTVVDGLVTAIGTGATTITVTSTVDAELTRTIPVTVERSTIQLNHTELDLILGGATVTVTHSIPNVINQAVTWASGDTSIVTVVGGVVTAVAVGETTITVTSVADPGLYVEIPVEVREIVMLESITLIYDELDLPATGAEVVSFWRADFQQLSYRVYPANTEETSLVWSTTNALVVSVTQDGRITSNLVGTATITVTDTITGISASALIRVGLFGDALVGGAIRTPEQFSLMNYNLSGNFWLENDIDFSNGTGEMVDLFPIAGSDGAGLPFSGTFDGRGHTLSNFMIYETNAWELGLFRAVTGTIRNFNVTNAGIYNNGGSSGTIVAVLRPSGVIENVAIEMERGGWYYGPETDLWRMNGAVVGRMEAGSRMTNVLVNVTAGGDQETNRVTNIVQNLYAATISNVFIVADGLPWNRNSHGGGGGATLTNIQRFYLSDVATIDFGTLPAHFWGINTETGLPMLIPYGERIAVTVPANTAGSVLNAGTAASSLNGFAFSVRVLNTHQGIPQISYTIAGVTTPLTPIRDTVNADGTIDHFFRIEQAAGPITLTQVSGITPRPARTITNLIPAGGQEFGFRAWTGVGTTPGGVGLPTSVVDRNALHFAVRITAQQMPPADASHLAFTVRIGTAYHEFRPVNYITVVVGPNMHVDYFFTIPATLVVANIVFTQVNITPPVTEAQIIQARATRIQEVRAEFNTLFQEVDYRSADWAELQRLLQEEEAAINALNILGAIQGYQVNWAPFNLVPTDAQRIAAELAAAIDVLLSEFETAFEAEFDELDFTPEIWDIKLIVYNSIRGSIQSFNNIAQVNEFNIAENITIIREVNVVFAINMQIDGLLAADITTANWRIHLESFRTLQDSIAALTPQELEDVNQDGVTTIGERLFTAQDTYWTSRIDVLYAQFIGADILEIIELVVADVPPPGEIGELLTAIITAAYNFIELHGIVLNDYVIGDNEVFDRIVAVLERYILAGGLHEMLIELEAEIEFRGIVQGNYSTANWALVVTALDGVRNDILALTTVVDAQMFDVRFEVRRAIENIPTRQEYFTAEMMENMITLTADGAMLQMGGRGLPGGGGTGARSNQANFFGRYEDVSHLRVTIYERAFDATTLTLSDDWVEVGAVRFYYEWAVERLAPGGELFGDGEPHNSNTANHGWLFYTCDTNPVANFTRDPDSTAFGALTVGANTWFAYGNFGAGWQRSFHIIHFAAEPVLANILGAGRDMNSVYGIRSQIITTQESNKRNGPVSDIITSSAAWAGGAPHPLVAAANNFNSIAGLINADLSNIVYTNSLNGTISWALIENAQNAFSAIDQGNVPQMALVEAMAARLSNAYDRFRELEQERIEAFNSLVTAIGVASADEINAANFQDFVVEAGAAQEYYTNNLMASTRAQIAGSAQRVLLTEILYALDYHSPVTVLEQLFINAVNAIDAVITFDWPGYEILGGDSWPSINAAREAFAALGDEPIDGWNPYIVPSIDGLNAAIEEYRQIHLDLRVPAGPTNMGSPEFFQVNGQATIVALRGALSGETWLAGTNAAHIRAARVYVFDNNTATETSEALGWFYVVNPTTYGLGTEVNGTIVARSFFNPDGTRNYSYAGPVLVTSGAMGNIWMGGAGTNTAFLSILAEAGATGNVWFAGTFVPVAEQELVANRFVASGLSRFSPEYFTVS